MFKAEGYPAVCAVDTARGGLFALAFAAHPCAPIFSTTNTHQIHGQDLREKIPHHQEARESA
jgi:hypothetical protein